MRRGLQWTALLVALILYPFVDRALGFQTVHAVSDGMIYVLLALGLNIVVGYAGLLDLGYAAFFAIGAYAMGLLNSPVVGSPFYGHGWSFWLCIWVAAAVSALLGAPIAVPSSACAATTWRSSPWGSARSSRSRSEISATSRWISAAGGRSSGST